MRIAQSVEELIGNTPLLRLNRLFPNLNIYAKLESMNPAGSAKDRAAREMLDDYERRGLLAPGGTVVEPTSGNTGVALAALCAARGDVFEDGQGGAVSGLVRGRRGHAHAPDYAF